MKVIRKKFKYAQEIPKLPFGEHSDANTPGLFLIKRESSKNTWTYLYRVNGKQKRMDSRKTRQNIVARSAGNGSQI